MCHTGNASAWAFRRPLSRFPVQRTTWMRKKQEDASQRSHPLFPDPGPVAARTLVAVLSNLQTLHSSWRKRTPKKTKDQKKRKEKKKERGRGWHSAVLLRGWVLSTSGRHEKGPMASPRGDSSAPQHRWEWQRADNGSETTSQRKYIKFIYINI